MKKKNVEQVKTEKFDWHACSVDGTFKKVESSKDGLTQSEASERLAKNGAEIYLSRANIRLDGDIGCHVRMKDAKGNFFALGELREYPSGRAVKPVKFFKEENI